ncbi:MAG: hypothetical protein ABR606_13680 [Vicinamibacterales bacterium]
MVEATRGARFLLEAPQTVGIGGEDRGQDLHRHVTPEACSVGAIDLAHAAGPEQALNPVGSEPPPGCQHCGRNGQCGLAKVSRVAMRREGREDLVSQGVIGAHRGISKPKEDSPCHGDSETGRTVVRNVADANGPRPPDSRVIRGTPPTRCYSRYKPIRASGHSWPRCVTWESSMARYGNQ